MRRAVLMVATVLVALGLTSPAGAAPRPGSIADPMIAFTTTRYGGHTEIAVMTPLGRRVRRVTHQAPPVEGTPYLYGPDWSPNRSRILFGSGAYTDFSGTTAIEVIEATGRGRTTVASGSQYYFDGSQVGDADWAPGGRRITYVSTGTARFSYTRSLVLTSLRTGQGRTLAYAPIGDAGPAGWAPDGRRVVYPQASKVDPNVLSGLIVHDLVGNTRTVIAPSGSGPQWSPDGGLIAFVRGDSLFTITPEGEDETPLTTGGNPRWSPDGSRIAFVRDGNIWVIGRDGSGEAQLTTTGEDGDPNWSGNGGKIAFVSERDGNAEIYLMDADGGRQRNLTQNGAEDRDPDWRPAAP